MSLLEHPEALALLADADVSAADVQACQGRLESFLGRYLPLFYRHEQRELARVVIRGRISNLQRKTSEPIAYQAGRQRKPVQHFVGAGCWDDEAVQQELREHVAQEIGAADGVLIVDSSGFAKKGNSSCGVERQWCGRLGKLDNCQVGVFLAYATSRGSGIIGVSSLFRFPRPAARARQQGHAESLSHALDPALRAKRAARNHRLPQRREFLFGLRRVQPTLPIGSPLRLVSAQLRPHRRLAHRVIAVQPDMNAIARPQPIGQVAHQAGPQRIALCVTHHGQEMLVAFDHRTLEPALPHMAAGLSPTMNTPGVGDRQRLQDAADRLPALRRQHQVKVIGHQAVGVEIERVALASFPQRVEKGAKVGVAAKDRLAIIAAIDGVVNQTVVNESGQAWHGND